MYDSLKLEALGVPAIAICTEPFESGAKAIANLGGMPDYPFALIQHPIGSLTPEQMRERAIEAAPQVIASLLARRA
ncbi:hypothetical protein GKN94_14020 [Candidatus Lucifugimonas marina]|uniref:UGSC-like domain-containing protein n=1 Tax=Candidatus Lucifugimonas marina TaxID=3038979 RepID=A0AAJ5ZJW5_9CHLR|nr:hypothetical protein [SAR202 cluster bacterium JH702]MDG0869348.1 hypothetical protein [SAR202 cluster bacterium JH639]WFG36746.1 hypothetical protein GKN94_14020 [SAR202 cluster bacterium JH545]WFG40680.1 hypothetical protein GKO48_14065 [SAR202 cluster bacterium JH1073]